MQAKLELLNKHSDKLILAVDLAAAVFLGSEGTLTAIGADIDLFGALVLAFSTALGGGILRDLLIGSVPPGAIRDWHYACAAFLGGLIAFAMHGAIQQLPANFITTLDAIGLALFCVSGAAKAIDYKINAMMSVLMGTITGVGGGTIRDILLARIPGILRVDVYAVAALIGAAVFVLALKAKMPRPYAMALGAIVCFTVRMVSVSNHWNLPKLTAH